MSTPNPRKRPPPTSNAPRTQPLSIPGIDTLLAKYARNLPPGGTVTVTLIKGPSSSSVDPIAARRAAAANPDGEGENGHSNVIGKKHPGLEPLHFPRIAKFPETVSKPDFFGDGSGGSGSSGSIGAGGGVAKTYLKDGRMYEEEVPKAKDESDEDESTAYRPSNDDTKDSDDPTKSDNADGTSNPADSSSNNNPPNPSSNPNRKKKRRWRRNDPRPRRWVLQEKAEFFEKIAARRRRQARQRRMGGSTAWEDDDDEGDEKKLSNQYHGVVESNASKYVILSVGDGTGVNGGSNGGNATNVGKNTPFTKYAKEQIQILPVYGFHTFSQPYKTASLTMEEAESAIEQQRNVVTRYMMHGRLSSQVADKNEAAAVAAVGGVGRGGPGRRSGKAVGPPPKAMSRARLLGKLAGGGDDKDAEDDDVMGDIKFSTSRGTSRARKELLTSMADEGVTIDDDGVLGGANDAEFGGRRRFARVAVDKPDGEDNKSGKKGEAGGGTATGFEAGAMEEGFYQRDVSAEYEALDYDANEQFDDDDVNLGEDEIVDEGGGFGGDFDDSEEDDFESDEEEDVEDDLLKGMASSSGLKAMIAKARGELPVKPGEEGGAAATAAAAGLGGLAGAGAPGGAGVTSGDVTAKKGEGVDEDAKKVFDTTKKPTVALEPKKPEPTPTTEPAQKPSPLKEPKAVGIEKDKDGKRLITMEAIRREIWLNNGAIKSKRLMRKFDVTPKFPERQALFKSIVMELCTMKKDADGSKLVLKQHYAKSG